MTLRNRVKKIEKAGAMGKWFAPDKPEWLSIGKIISWLLNKQYSTSGQLGLIDKKLQCSAKGHGKWMLSKAEYKPDDSFVKAVFRCSLCGLEITKTKKELSPVERESLKGLKLI